MSDKIAAPVSNEPKVVYGYTLREWKALKEKSRKAHRESLFWPMIMLVVMVHAGFTGDLTPTSAFFYTGFGLALLGICGVASSSYKKKADVAQQELQSLSAEIGFSGIHVVGGNLEEK